MRRRIVSRYSRQASDPAPARFAGASATPSAKRATASASPPLSARASALLTLADHASTPERGRAALDELLRFRRAHEREWLGNFNHNAWVEDLSWKLSNATKQEPEHYP